MKYSAVLLLALVAMCYALPNPASLYQAEWEKFKQDYKKNYATETEEVHRHSVFTANYREILEHNKKFDAGEVTYKKGINQYSDLTPEEHAKIHTGLLLPGHQD